MPKRAIQNLGKIALHVRDLDAMQQFCQEVIGLELMRRFPNSAFFNTADGFADYTQILALFDRSLDPGYSGVAREKTALDLLAFCRERSPRRFRSDGHRHRARVVKWRSLYVKDPEGNSGELVCPDESIREKQSS